MDRRNEPDDDSSIELDALRSARPEPVPDAAVVDAHRDSLYSDIGRERISPRNRQVLRRVAVAAAAVPVLAGSVVMATGDGDGPGVDDLELTAASAFYNAPRCGTAPLPDIVVPDGFSGPVDGPSPDSDRPAAPDQLVRHWTSATGSLELRWYADPDAAPPVPADPPPDPVADDVDYVVLYLGRSGAASARPYGELVYGTEAGRADDPCTWVQVTAFDEAHDRIDDTIDAAARLCGGDVTLDGRDVDILEIVVDTFPRADQLGEGVLSASYIALEAGCSD